MPLCISSRAAALGGRGATLRRFTTSRHLLDPSDPADSHYDTLKVPAHATESDIKKSFYALSKIHHPDRNPSDPHAPKRFIRITEAYNILSAPLKRAAYDRDLLPAHRSAPPQTYYTATGPAGGRPASGLSSRRTTTTSSARGPFRGPPRSFYERGGYGAHGERRRAEHEESTGGPMGGMGYGQDPFHRERGAPHFDRDAHERTHRRQDERRARRPGGDPQERGGEGSSSFGFVLVVGAILASAGLVPLAVVGALGEGEEVPRRKRG